MDIRVSIVNQVRKVITDVAKERRKRCNLSTPGEGDEEREKKGGYGTVLALPYHLLLLDSFRFPSPPPPLPSPPQRVCRRDDEWLLA